jgi:CRISPR-associated RAMP protein (TIGR02581 family)
MSMTTNFGYNVFRCRIKLTGTVMLKSGLHIGKGRALDPTASDLPVLKDRSGNPFIPGSSLKGVLRSNLEAWLRAFFPLNWQRFACERIARESDRHCVSNERKEQIMLQHRDTPSEADRLLWEESCWICRLFGSPWLASKVQVVDLPVKDPWQPEWLMIRDGVAIDRDSETAAIGALYDFEAVPAGASFKLEMLVENPEDYEMGLLMVGFDLLNDGYTLLGGNTSRGLGRVKVDIDDISILTPGKLLESLRPSEPSGEFKSSPAESEKAPKEPFGSEGSRNPDDPLEALVTCLHELGSATRDELIAAMQQKGWTKERFQKALGKGSKFNWDQLFQLAIEQGKAELREGRFSLPGAPTAILTEQPSPKSEEETAMKELEKKQREIEQIRRRWKEALYQKIHKEMEEAKCSERFTTRSNS